LKDKIAGWTKGAIGRAGIAKTRLDIAKKRFDSLICLIFVR
jgi:hypothetical protein